MIKYRYFKRFLDVISTLKRNIYNFILHSAFKEFGKNSRFENRATLKGEEYIAIGNNTHFGKDCSIEFWEKYCNNLSSCGINIGDNCNFGDDLRITCTNQIEIGDWFLCGKSVTITDNSHGDTALLCDNETPPIYRPIISKGSVIIGNNVWIGDKVIILPNIKIGDNSIIGAGSVVTKDVEPNSVYVGNPARKVK